MANEHEISLTEAAALTSRFRSQRNLVLREDLRGQDILPIAETFDIAAITKLLVHDDVKAFRIYYGMSEDLKMHAVLVGVNEENEDILPTAENERVLIEHSNRCPISCPPKSALNSD